MSAMPSARSAFRSLLIAGAGLSALLGAGTALAQRTPSVENRVDRLEQEMRAVQRKVFPGGAGQLVTPDVTPTPTPGIVPGTPAESPIADLTARVSAIEAQVARLTGQVEENQNKLRQLEDQVARLSGPPAAPILPTEAPPPSGGGGRGSGSAAAAPQTPAPAPAAAPGDQAARNQQVAAVERPSTGNAALDSYTYGYRLWSAHFYPEAQAQLQATLDKYPNDPIASRTQNLLGRAFLDDGKPYTAVTIFYENYRKRPQGERAAESLAWTGEALIRVNDLNRACVVYEQIGEEFGTTMPDNVRQMMMDGKARAKCGA